jgi:hypothetical protein
MAAVCEYNGPMRLGCHSSRQTSYALALLACVSVVVHKVSALLLMYCIGADASVFVARIQRRIPCGLALY